MKTASITFNRQNNEASEYLRTNVLRLVARNKKGPQCKELQEGKIL